MANDRKPKPIDPKLCELVWEVVTESRTRFIQHRAEVKYVPQDWRPAELGWFETGFPQISRATGFAPRTVDYDGAFGLGGKDRDSIDFRSLDAWPPLLKYAEANERLRQSFL